MAKSRRPRALARPLSNREWQMLVALVHMAQGDEPAPEFWSLHLPAPTPPDVELVTLKTKCILNQRTE